ncbi:hypothetical protein C8R45DRAFT_765492, partial [Mycena sanguinolenta]
FAPSHPQYTSHCMKKLSDTEDARVPVLVGVLIPRDDREEDKESHQVAMLALFKPWTQNVNSPLKELDQDWHSVYTGMMTNIRPAHHHIMDNMQLLHKSRDAKHDFSAIRRK